MIATHARAALLVSAAASRLSEIWIDFPSDLNRIDFLSSSVKLLIVDLSESLKTLQKNSSALYLSTISSHCLKLIANVGNFFGKIRKPEAANAHLNLITLRQSFLETLSKVAAKNTAEKCAKDDNECLAIGSVNNSTYGSSVGVSGSKSGGGAVIIDDDSDFVAVSTYNFNPFPELENITDLLDDESEQEFLDINTPVIGILSISKQQTAKPKVAPSFDVVIPLGSNVFSSNVALYLAPLCDPRIVVDVGSYVSVDNLHKLCGPTSIKFKTTLVTRPSFDPTLANKNNLKPSRNSTVGYMILRLETKCYSLNESCILVHFSRPRRPSGCAQSNDSCISGYDVLYTVSLPRSVNMTSTLQKDPFSIPLSEQILFNISLSDGSAFILLEDLQPDPLVNIRVGASKFRKVIIGSFSYYVLLH